MFFAVCSLAGLLWSLACLLRLVLWLAAPFLWLDLLRLLFGLFGPCLVLSCHGCELRVRRIAEYYGFAFVSVPWLIPSDTFFPAVVSSVPVQCSIVLRLVVFCALLCIAFILRHKCATSQLRE